MKNKIVCIECDDWTAIYANNKLVTEGHSIPKEIMFKISQQYPTSDYRSIYVDSGEQEQLNLWDFPEYLNGLPEEIYNQII